MIFPSVSRFARWSAVFALSLGSALLVSADEVARELPLGAEGGGVPAGKQPQQAEDALRRYTELRIKATALKAKADEAAVLAALGEPLGRGVGGWGRIGTDVWTYLNYVDDTQFLYFTVRFDEREGVAVGAVHNLRAEFSKRPKLIARGTVVAADPRSKGQPDFSCTVKFDDGVTAGVEVMDRARVKGDPEKGARIEIEHHGSPGVYVFKGQGSLYLEAMTFTAPKMQGAEKTAMAGGKP